MATTQPGRLPEFRIERAVDRPDGRRVVWAETGDPQGQYVLRLPGAPASRLQVPINFSVWQEHGLRMVMTERPGYGSSSPLVGYSVADYADDLAAILDVNEVERVPVTAYGVGAIYALGFAAMHPDRVQALAIVGGQGPVTLDDVAAMVPLNRDSWSAVLRQDRRALAHVLGGMVSAMDLDPLGGIYTAMGSVPESDWQRIVTIDWQRRWAADVAEALRNGVEAWVEDSLTLGRGWRDFDPAVVHCPVSWFHAEGDRNAPIAAARRAVEMLPQAQFVQWPLTEGSLVTPEHEAEVLASLGLRR